MSLIYEGVEHDPAVGYSQKFEFSEVLDSASISVPHLPKTDFKVWTPITLEGRVWIILKINRQISDRDENNIQLWNYTLQLVSPTILLQRTTMPNRAFTQDISPNGVKLNIADVIDRILIQSGYIERNFNNLEVANWNNV